MIEHKRQHDCQPPDHPADLPKPPGGSCEPLTDADPPELKEPEKCPPSDCNCPTTPGSDPNCLETLIAKKAADIAAAEKAKAFKTDLEGLLGKAKTAAQDYTQEKHEKLLKQWEDQDKSIASLIHTLDCALPCWRCVIECYVCPLLHEMRYAEQRLYGDGTLSTDIRTLHDLRHWHARDRDAKEHRFNRIKQVLTAWEKPSQTIEKALADNAKLIADLEKAIRPEPSKIVFDVFLRLVPLHLAIAPPASSGIETLIDEKYTEFCECGEYEPDDCCGPDVGPGTPRQRFIGPQPYLIDPAAYLDLICCLVEHRYGPAQDAFGKAEAALMAVEDEIKRNKALIDNGLKSFDKDAKGRIPGLIDCRKFDKDEEPTQTTPRAR